MGFKSFKSYGSRVAIPTIIKVIVPQSSNILMAVGGGAPNVNTNIITSTDNGLTWSINTAGSQALLNKGNGNAGSSIIYNPSNNTWVAVIGNNYMYSKDDGITWIPDSTQNFNIVSIQTNKDIYIICGFIGSRTVWYSYDFSTITNSDSFPLMGNNANASIYDGSKWIVVGNGGDGKNNIITSADGIAWVYNGNGTDRLLTQIFCIAYNGSISTPIYLVGGAKEVETMLYSTDCINWVATTNGTSLTQQVYGIGWNGTNQWVVIGVSLDKTGVVMYSSDGMNWIKSISGSDYMNGFITSNSGVALGTVSYINDSWFVGGCSTTSDIIKSTDGINWTASDNTFNVAGYGCISIASKTTLLIAGGSGTNTISLSPDNGVSWTLPSNQPFTQRGYGCGFDGNRIVMGGNADIAYSDDYGNSWVSTGFTTISLVYAIKYFTETKMWFAMGATSSNQTIAMSSDGINWSISNIIFTRGRCYDMIYNGSVYIASGWGDYPTATSSDGITWAYNTTLAYQNTSRKFNFDFFYDGSRFILGGTGHNPNSNLATSQDGITWVENGYIPMDIRGIAYNGVDTYVAVGSRTNNTDPGIYYYWSNDLITWNAPVNNLLGTVEVYCIIWDKTNFVVGSQGGNIIYSADGKNWTPSDNTLFTGFAYKFTQITY